MLIIDTDFWKKKYSLFVGVCVSYSLYILLALFQELSASFFVIFLAIFEPIIHFKFWHIYKWCRL